MSILLTLLAQAAPAPPPRSFSILVDPCARSTEDSSKDVIVCGGPEAIAPRLPLPNYRGVPDHAVPSNPEMKASVALDGPGIGTECGAYGENCPVGGGGYIVPALVNGAIAAVKSAFARKPDKRGRVAIDLTEPATAGKVQP